MTTPDFNNEDLAIKILNDAIIFYRIAENFGNAMAAFEPSQIETFKPGLNYLGFYTAFELMGIGETSENGSLIDDLSEIGWEYCRKNEPADIVARELYFRWIYELQEKLETAE